jgi:hypothetical protein
MDLDIQTLRLGAFHKDQERQNCRFLENSSDDIY